jgi:hypothetical protein
MMPFRKIAYGPMSNASSNFSHQKVSTVLHSFQPMMHFNEIHGQDGHTWLFDSDCTSANLVSVYFIHPVINH